VVDQNGGFVVMVSEFVSEHGEGRIEIIRRRTNGGPVASQSIPYQPQSLPRASWDSALAVRAKHPLLSPEARTALKRLAAPRTVPAVGSLLVSPKGEVWLHLTTASLRRVWLVLPPNGSDPFTVELPPNADLRLIDDARLWAVVTDNEDSEHLVRYDLERP
jgi:hypothetical protein